MPEHAFLKVGPTVQPVGEVVNDITPTLVLGLGGSGKEVVCRLRRMFFERYGVVGFPMIGYLVIDSDNKPADAGLANRGAEMSREILELRKGVRHQQPEFISCDLGRRGYDKYFGPAGSRALPHVAAWLDWTLRQYGANAMTQGNGLRRPFGRLSFFEHFREIKLAIEHQLTALVDAAANAPDGKNWAPAGVKAQTDPKRIEVIVVHSLVGGTGAGMFIDVNYLVRKILDERFDGLKAHISDIAFLPGAWEDLLSQEDHKLRLAQANAYACLMEMEHYSVQRWDMQHFSGTAGAGCSVNAFEVQWSADDDKLVFDRGAPWHTCYLLDNRNETFLGQCSLDDLYEMVAEYLMLDFEPTEFGALKRAFRPNDEVEQGRDVAQNVPTNAQPVFSNIYSCRFCSFGLARIYHDEDRVRRAMAYDLAARLIERQIGKEGDDHEMRELGKKHLSGGEILGEDDDLEFKVDFLVSRTLGGEAEAGSVKQEAQDEYKQLRESFPLDVRTARELLEALNNKHRIRTAPGGDATIRIEHQVSELLPRLRRRLVKLSQDGLAKYGATMAAQLVNEYSRRLGKLSEQLNKIANQTPAEDHEIFSRLDEIPALWHRRQAALTIEFPRAVAFAWRRHTAILYDRNAAVHLKGAVNDLIRFLREELSQQYRAMLTALESQKREQEGWFQQTLHAPASPRNYRLQVFDQPEEFAEYRAKLLPRDGKKRIQWQAIEERVYGSVQNSPGYRQYTNRVSALAQQVAGGNAPQKETTKRYMSVFARGCYELFRDLIGGTDAVEWLLGDRIPDMERSEALRRLRERSGVYFRQSAAILIPRNDAGRRVYLAQNMANPQQQDALATKLRDDGMALAGRPQQGEPAAIVVYQGLAGLSLCGYDGLSHLARAYENETIAHLHIDFRGTKLFLPAIDPVTQETFTNVHRCAPDFLFAAMVGDVKFDRWDEKVERDVFWLRRRPTRDEWHRVATRYDRTIKEIAGCARGRAPHTGVTLMESLQALRTDWFARLTSEEPQEQARRMVTLFVGLQWLKKRVSAIIQDGGGSHVANPIYWSAEANLQELRERLLGAPDGIGEDYLKLYDDDRTDADVDRIKQAQESCFVQGLGEYPIPVVKESVPPLHLQDEDGEE